MENMTVFILGIAILSAGTYLMRLGGRSLATGWRFQNGRRRCFQTRLPFCCSPSRWRQRFMKGTILPGWHVCWAWGSRCFWRRKMPLIVVIVAAAVVTALLRLAGIN